MSRVTGRSSGVKACLLALVIAATPACGPPSPASPPAPAPAESAPAPAAPPGERRSSKPPASSNAGVLEAAMTAEGHGKLQLQSSSEGQFVSLVHFRTMNTRASRPQDQLAGWLDTYGDTLGYGALGERQFDSASFGGNEPVVVGTVRFPGAKNCPGLTMHAAFDVVAGRGSAPKVFVLLCGAGAGASPVVDRSRALFDRLRAAPAPDALRDWLRDQGLTAGSVTRRNDGVSASLEPSASPVTTARLAYVKAFAERVARAEGLPALDQVELTPAKKPTDPRPLEVRFERLELRLVRPPLDGACIDPRVSVEVRAAGAAPPSPSGGDPSFALASLDVRCEREPSGATAPADAARTLPRTAAGALPFLAVCEYFDFVGGRHHTGRVIDKRGDVYTFAGGEAFSGASAHELGMLLRHGKAYVGTLTPADVDRLAALTPSVATEPFRKTPQEVFDAPGGGCSLLHTGTNPDALVRVALEAVGRELGSRVGPASTSARAILDRAKKLGP
jgi:hypothetical protein